tara:strand:- start:688 stop:1815 length:1128 start_codon:yes stop_codon:yes gene_type:complete
LKVLQLSTSGLRSLDLLTIFPSSGLNFIFGKNNAGKTSLLEALYLCGNAKSFKQTNVDCLIKKDKKNLKILLKSVKFGENDTISYEKTLNIQKKAKINDKSANTFSLMVQTPLVCLTFGSENLINLSPEHRRSLLDTGLFHVKHEYYEIYKSFSNNLKQRNKLLKTATYENLDFWTNKIIEDSLIINKHRGDYFQKLQRAYAAIIQEMVGFDKETYGDIKNSRISYYQGWPKDLSVEEAYASCLEKDKALKYSTTGPHRADVFITTDADNIKEIGSMSTQIIVSLCFMLAQARVFHVEQKYRPILLIDDLFFGIDDKNLALVINLLLGSKIQCFLTAPDLYKETITGLNLEHREAKMFELKNGVITEEKNAKKNI